MRARRYAMFGFFAFAATGCSPLSAIAPFHLAETAETLEKKEVSITAMAGAAGAGLDGQGAGGDVRVRVGVGAHQEVGFEGEVLYANTGTPTTSTPPWIGESLSLGLKLSWKAAPCSWFAVIAGTGYTDSVTGSALAGDFAIVFSTPHALHKWFRPYGGLRATIAIPVGRGIYEAGGPTGGVVVPFGFSIEPTPWVRFYFEGGVVGLVSRGYTEPTSTTGPTSDEVFPRTISNNTHGGGYGAFGMAFILGRHTR